MKENSSHFQDNYIQQIFSSSYSLEQYWIGEKKKKFINSSSSVFVNLEQAGGKEPWFTICWFPLCEYSCHGWFQATSGLAAGSPSSRKYNSEFLWAHMSQL